MECCCCSLLFYASIFFGLVYAYFKWSFNYWKRRNVPTPETYFPLGNIDNPVTVKDNFCILLMKFYKQFKPTGAKHYGLFMFSNPMYVVMDLDLIKTILIKDFNNFVDRGVYYNEKDDPLSAHMFSIGGNKWRNLRNKLSPTFTSGRMKMMFNTLLDVGVQMEKKLAELSGANEPLDIKEIVARFSTDIIGSCAFGIDCNSFVNPDSEFRKYGKRVFQADFIDNMKGMICFFYPNFARKLGLIFTNKEVSAFFMKMIKDTIKYREENNITRNDFMNLLLELKNGKNEGENLKIEEIAAQAFVFFLAGFETSSTTITFCLFELAQHKEIQDKLRKEIFSVMDKHEGKVTYDALSEMKYLAKVIDETLRKYPPVPQLNRVCLNRYQVPDTDTILEPGMQMVVPVYAIQRDPEYFPDPEKFDPERFTEDSKAERHPFTFLPFGEGPRNCVGLRFGLMQTKIGLISVLKNYKISLNPKTELPLRLDPFSFTLSTKQTIWIDAKKVE